MNDREQDDTSLEPLWRALGDPTRRSILDLLRERPRTTGELAAAFPSSRFAVMKHLTVLVEAGLVVVRRQGRERFNHLNAVPLQTLYERWVRPYEAHWSSGLLRLKDHVERGGRSMAGAAQGLAEPRIAQVELEVGIAAPRERVWKALVEETGRWWRPDFFSVPEPRDFVLEPRIGGRMYEQGENGAAVLWATVIAIDPGRSLDLVAHLTAAFGGPTLSLLRLELREEGAATVFRLSDSLLGRVGEKSPATIEAGWRQLFAEGLKPYAEAGAGG